MKLKRKNNLFASIAGLSFWAVISFPVGVLAAKAAACQTSVGGFLGFPTWYKFLNPTFADGECQLTFDIAKDLPKVLLAVFEILLRVGGMVAVAMIIYGGIQYILSQGEPDKTKGARTTIINAIVGLVIAMSAVVIVNLVGKNV